MQYLHLDIFSGLSGDMFIGALMDLGVELRHLEQELRKLPLDGYHLHARRARKADLEGVKFDVHLDAEITDPASGPSPAAVHRHSHGPGGVEHSHGEGQGPHRNHAEIRQLISGSPLNDWVKERALSVFQRLAVAEGRIHGVPPEQVHFHEVGAVDSIVDIVGACIGLDRLGRPRVRSGPVVEGTGWVRCAHGRMPLPAPATLAILGARGVAISQCEEPHELVTPTGAALLAEFAETFGPMTGVVGARIGYGLGTRENRTRPNLVRALLWEDATGAATWDWETDSVSVLETNVDDLSAEILGHVLEKSLRQGALDAFHTPVQMKKQRPGVLITILCEPTDADRFTELLLTETSAFGVRRTLAERRKLRREWIQVTTPFGTVQVKLGRLGGGVVQVAPEFESCRSVAVQAGVPLKDVYAAAQKAALA
jgi:uncharacterized protein (TIGR00299 family) protein